ncbi:MAG: biosynthetic arginine decarboxylase [Planctomycetota bacterium]
MADIQWSVVDSASLYGINRWGEGYFGINPTGSVQVQPFGDGVQAIDLRGLVDELGKQGLELPVLLRFNDILRDRIKRVHTSFRHAIEEHEYPASYRCVYPIKVNQQREVVQQIVDAGDEHGFGIEAGSKPELLAAIAMSPPTMPVVCNGFKDHEYLRLAMMAAKLKRTIIPVIEKRSELDELLHVAADLGVRPTLGMRVKLATRGTGRWQASGGYRSKFGLTVGEILDALDLLKSSGMEDCFQLLHFHVGSQIGDIRRLKTAILEAARIYVDLRRRGAAMGYLDVGGGLGVDYDGTMTDNPSSLNYTIQEYANDVVFHVQTVCQQAEVEPPCLISESGRAIAAHHSILVVETLGVGGQGVDRTNAKVLPLWSSSIREGKEATDSHFEQPLEQPVWMLCETYRDLKISNALESFHDAQNALDLSMNLFSGGYLSLEQRVAAETIYFTICHRVRDLVNASDIRSPELNELDQLLSDTYFMNFSIFQSLPDAWAIEQRFPVMPIERLDEEPTRNAVIADITCDSDGKLDSFACQGEIHQSLKLHTLNAGEPYRLGIFLVGAYQEILGDLHNLFGDTHAVHVDVIDGKPNIRSVVHGDTVSEVLGYVQYDDTCLLEGIQTSVNEALAGNRIDAKSALEIKQTFERSLRGYTYLGKPQKS